MNSTEFLITVLLLSAATSISRFLPFLVFGKFKTTPKLIDYLGRVLPGAMMGLLVVYCFREVSFSDMNTLLPTLIASAAVVGVHLYKRNTILSISLGTVLYMILLRVM